MEYWRTPRTNGAGRVGVACRGAAKVFHVSVPLVLPLVCGKLPFLGAGLPVGHAPSLPVLTSAALVKPWMKVAQCLPR